MAEINVSIKELRLRLLNFILNFASLFNYFAVFRLIKLTY